MYEIFQVTCVSETLAPSYTRYTANHFSFEGDVLRNFSQHCIRAKQSFDLDLIRNEDRCNILRVTEVHVAITALKHDTFFRPKTIWTIFQSRNYKWFHKFTVEFQG